MERAHCLFIALILLICWFLTGCSEEKDYEVVKAESKITESVDQIQLELDYEIANHSDEDCYFTFVFPSYIQDALMSNVGINSISANSSVSGVAVIAVSKEGVEMTKEIIAGILQGEVPFIKSILIGKTIGIN